MLPVTITIISQADITHIPKQRHHINNVLSHSLTAPSAPPPLPWMLPGYQPDHFTSWHHTHQHRHHIHNSLSLLPSPPLPPVSRLMRSCCPLLVPALMRRAGGRPCWHDAQSGWPSVYLHRSTLTAWGTTSCC